MTVDSAVSSLLSLDFLGQEKYKTTPNNAGVTEAITRLRTYSRYDHLKKRRETWAETVKRVVEYSLSLYSGPATREELVKEAELMFDKVYNLEVLPAGRTLWVGGTKASEMLAMGNFNCCYLNIENGAKYNLPVFSCFSDIFYLLLCGCGVGYGIQKDLVQTLPKINSDFYINHRNYVPLSARKRSDATICYKLEGGTYLISVGDSKEAWVKALGDYFDLLLKAEGPIQIEFDYNNVRPAGERLKTFGGRAAGPKGLEIMFSKITKIIKSCDGKLSPVAAMDISNMIAENVLVGGTRRSAQIALASPNDEEFKNAKLDLYIYDREKGKFVLDPERSHRRMSNNSIVYDKRPSIRDIEGVFKNILNNGEPGFFNREAAMKRRGGNAVGVNPCAEILLDNFGVCNLSTVVITSHIKEDGTLDLYKLKESFELATRIGMRQTNVTLNLPHWDIIQKRDRLTGVSMTGLMKTLDLLGLTHKDPKVKLWLRSFRLWSNMEADRYSEEMSIPRPLLVTAVKPEGTLTLLSKATSPGLHRSYAPYYIRRISVSELDPVCKALQILGVPNEPKYETDNEDKTRRILFSFPIDSGAKTSADDESGLDQLDRYLTMQREYTDHNSSCTITIGRKEWKKVAKAVYKNWDDIVACAFLPKVESTPSTMWEKLLDIFGLFRDKIKPYPQMPYEAITKEKYEEMMSIFPSLDRLEELVNSLEEQEPEEDEIDSDCKSGFCPPR